MKTFFLILILFSNNILAQANDPLFGDTPSLLEKFFKKDFLDKFSPFHNRDLMNMDFPAMGNLKVIWEDREKEGVMIVSGKNLKEKNLDFNIKNQVVTISGKTISESKFGKSVSSFSRTELIPDGHRPDSAEFKWEEDKIEIIFQRDENYKKGIKKIKIDKGSGQEKNDDLVPLSPKSGDITI